MVGSDETINSICGYILQSCWSGKEIIISINSVEYIVLFVHLLSVVCDVLRTPAIYEAVTPAPILLLHPFPTTALYWATLKQSQRLFEKLTVMELFASCCISDNQNICAFISIIYMYYDIGYMYIGSLYNYDTNAPLPNLCLVPIVFVIAFIL